MISLRLCHLTPPTILAIIHISAPLLLFHVVPRLRTTFPLNLVVHTLTTTMSQAPLAPDSESMPTAAAWIQSRLTALYESDVAGVQDAFDRTFSPLCEVRLNHAVQPLQTFRDDVAARRTAATHVSVAWSNLGSSHSGGGVISTNEDKPKEPAVVAGALVVTRSLPFRIRVSPAQRQTYIYFSAQIERDLGVQGGDPRRITSFYYTSVDKTPPIHFAVPRAAQAGGSEGQ